MINMARHPSSRASIPTHMPIAKDRSEEEDLEDSKTLVARLVAEPVALRLTFSRHFLALRLVVARGAGDPKPFEDTI
jgi:hypothetical protein